MIPVLMLLAVAYWLAAPDPVTAGARTAAGTGVRAAGSGARAQWTAGRKDRAVSRTKRRDRWHKAGGLRRFLLGLEHAAVVAGKVAKGSGKLAAAAVRPVPAAARAGWSSGVERHRARAKDRPVPIAVDPPWWHRYTPAGQVHEQPATGAVCSRCGRRAGQDEVLGYYYAVGDVRLCDQCEKWLDRRYPDGWPSDPAEVTEFGQGQRWPSTTVSPEIDPRTGRPVQARDTPEASPGTGPGQAPGTGAPPAATPTDQPAGLVPAGVTTPTTEGDPMPSYTTANVPSVELNDLDSLRRFAEYIASLGDDSEFMQIVERCKTLRESLREGGFGGHVDQAGASFEETAAALGQLGTEFCEEAAQMAQLAANVAGG